MRKFPLFAGLVMTTVLAAMPLYAAPEGTPAPADGEKKTEQSAEIVTPRTQVDGFFARLMEGRIDVAYDQLVKGTIIDHNPKVLAELKTKTKDAIRMFGAINGYELVESKDEGRHLKRLTCYSLGKNYPIRWRFYFYETDNKWVLLDLRVNVQLANYFDEPAPEVSAPAK